MSNETEDMRDEIDDPQSNIMLKAYTLKFLLAGDADVGKQAILDAINESFAHSSTFRQGSVSAVVSLMTVDGINVRAFFWDAPGQGRFNRIYENYSNGAEGVFLTFDITNRWSFEGLGGWIKELDALVPGIPKILIGNNLHKAYDRTVSELEAERFASKHKLDYWEVSTHCNFNIIESCWHMVRLALNDKDPSIPFSHEPVLQLSELCAREIAKRSTLYSIDNVHLPLLLRLKLKSYKGLHSTKRSRSLRASTFKLSTSRGDRAGNLWNQCVIQ